MSRSCLPALATACALATLALAPLASHAQSRVQYGRITHAVVVTDVNRSAQNVGTVVGGTVGLVSGGGQSGGNRALRTVGGAAAGRGVGTVAGRSQAVEYTVLVDGRATIRVVSDQVGKRVGDCVAVEQGNFNNIRLAPDSRCAPPAAPTQPSAPAADVEAATACDQAKQQLLQADTDDAFDRAERRMRLLCGE